MILTVRIAGVISVTLALACCAPPDAPLTADQAARAACRQQAEQSHDIRDRADRYKPDYGRDAPLSGQAAPPIDRGLVDRYSYERDYQDCLRSRGSRQTPTTLPAAGSSSAPSPAPAFPAPAAPAPANPSDLTRPPALPR